MPIRLEPRLDILPAAQRFLWPQLSAAPRLSYVLYGGTGVALHRGHRRSEDFDFFRHQPLSIEELQGSFPFIRDGNVVQEERETFVLLAPTPSGVVKVSFFGGIGFGRVSEPLLTTDGTLLVASLDDLLVTKLKAILARAEARDYVDIAEILRAGASLGRALSAFRQMFAGEPATVLRAIGYFDDGDLHRLPVADRNLLRAARDQVGDLPDVRIARGTLAPS